MEFNYLVGLQQVETSMKKQFDMPDNPEEPDRQSNVLCGSQPLREECKC